MNCLYIGRGDLGSGHLQENCLYMHGRKYIGKSEFAHFGYTPFRKEMLKKYKITQKIGFQISYE